jgi:hypothetical protein
MSLFHKFQDVYFDAVRLREALEKIPQQCECMDADAHLEGKCCCAAAHQGGHRSTESEAESSKGCMKSISKLRDGIQWFQDDLRNLSRVFHRTKHLNDLGRLMTDRIIEFSRRMFFNFSLFLGTSVWKTLWYFFRFGCVNPHTQ